MPLLDTHSDASQKVSPSVRLNALPMNGNQSGIRGGSGDPSRPCPGRQRYHLRRSNSAKMAAANINGSILKGLRRYGREAKWIMMSEVGRTRWTSLVETPKSVGRMRLSELYEESSVHTIRQATTGASTCTEANEAAQRVGALISKSQAKVTAHSEQQVILIMHKDWGDLRHRPSASWSARLSHAASGRSSRSEAMGDEASI